MYSLGVTSAALVLLIVFQSCQSPKYLRKIEECPPPPQPQCKPAQWSGTPFDTTSSGKFAPERYYVIAPVRGIAETGAQEWSLGFSGRQTALLTSGAYNEQRMNWCGFGKPDSATLQDVVASPVAGAFGNAVLLQPKVQGAQQRLSQVVISSYTTGSFRNDVNISTAFVSANDMSKLTEIPQASAQFSWDAHPALSPDGKLMVFASDRDGGIGGVDLWYCVKQNDGSWSEARNAGTSVNTECDELSPFITTDGATLLFSSMGHETVGGYDIFSAAIPKGFSPNATFGKATNIGAPLNTVFDEIFPSSPDNPAELLYYSTNQIRRTDFDMFVRYKREFPKRALVKKNDDENNDDEEPVDEPKETKQKKKKRKTTPEQVELTGTVLDKKNKPVNNADVKVRDVEEDEIVARTKTDTSGRYNVKVPKGVELEVTADFKDGFYDSHVIKIDKPGKRMENFVVPDEIALRVNFPNDDFQNPYRFVLDTNGTESAQEWKAQLNLLAENIRRSKSRIIKIIITGHTDENGAEDYNIALGQRRVEFVVNELAKRGIDRTLFDMRSAGESEPLQRRNAEANDVYYKRNRRVELRKVMKDG